MASNIRELIERCIANDSAAWAELCQIVVRVASPPIRKMLRSHGFGVDQVDDVLQNLYIYLQAREARYLTNFHGTTEEEFGAYVHTIAERFTAKRLKRWLHDRERELKALREVAQIERHGPTEEQIEALQRELRAHMPEEDRRKLDIVSGLCSSTEPVAESTIRRWRLELFRKYGHLI